MAISLAKTLSYYKRKDIQEEIIKQAKDKEIAFMFGDFFGKRPEILTYPADILELAKQKMTSLHCSEENWKNPLQLATGIKKEEMMDLRKGWDLVLDIDCKFFEYSRLAAYLTIKTLQENGVTSITAKFSGNKGFHIAVPFEAFPHSMGGKRMSDLFPDAPRRIAAYITYKIREQLSKEILKLEQGSFKSIMEKTGFTANDITMYEKNEFGDKIARLNVDPFLEIDTILISPRHLFRMPYSFHDKSGLVSVPIDINDVLNFSKKDAEPDVVVVKHKFLDRNVVFSDAEKLLRNAFDHAPASSEKDVFQEQGKQFVEGKKEYAVPEQAIGEEHFPPCIKLILLGLEDGKKRSCFAMINFLASCGWSFDMIEKRLLEWNAVNRVPLREQYLLGQIRYARAQKKASPPPNCNNANYYKGLQVCKPDELCRKIKNPLQYAKAKAAISERVAKANTPRVSKKKVEEKKETLS